MVFIVISTTRVRKHYKNHEEFSIIQNSTKPKSQITNFEVFKTHQQQFENYKNNEKLKNTPK